MRYPTTRGTLTILMMIGVLGISVTDSNAVCPRTILHLEHGVTLFPRLSPTEPSKVSIPLLFPPSDVRAVSVRLTVPVASVQSQTGVTHVDHRMLNLKLQATVADEEQSGTFAVIILSLEPAQLDDVSVVVTEACP